MAPRTKPHSLVTSRSERPHACGSILRGHVPRACPWVSSPTLARTPSSRPWLSLALGRGLRGRPSILPGPGWQQAMLPCPPLPGDPTPFLLVSRVSSSAFSIRLAFHTLGWCLLPGGRPGCQGSASWLWETLSWGPSGEVTETTPRQRRVCQMSQLDKRVQSQVSHVG
jgi:hypothetical protein